MPWFIHTFSGTCILYKERPTNNPKIKQMTLGSPSQYEMGKQSLHFLWVCISSLWVDSVELPFDSFCCSVESVSWTKSDSLPYFYSKNNIVVPVSSTASQHPGQPFNILQCCGQARGLRKCGLTLSGHHHSE